MFKPFSLIVALLTALLTAQSTFSQVNPNANARTKRLYQYIASLGNNGTENHLLLGQHASSRLETYQGMRIDPKNEWLSWLTYWDELYWDLAKEYNNECHLALIGVDFGVNQPVEDPTGIPPVANANSKPSYATMDAEKFAAIGCIVTASWHVNNPWTETGSKDRTNVDLKALLPGGKSRSIWLKKLDTIASELRKLQDNDRTILWRPFHEMNADFFWWGKAPPSEYKALWVDMFNYFTKTKRLNNLIWVYTPYNMDGDDRLPYNTYYPGDAYVDIVGIDVYDDVKIVGNTVQNPLEIRQYESLKAIAPKKPLICGELGPNEIKTGSDWNDFLDQLQTSYPEIVMALAWNDWFDDADPDVQKWTYKSIYKNKHSGVLKHQSVITLEELPK